MNVGKCENCFFHDLVSHYSISCGAGIRTPDTRIIIPTRNAIVNLMTIKRLPPYGFANHQLRPAPFATFGHQRVAESGRSKLTVQILLRFMLPRNVPIFNRDTIKKPRLGIKTAIFLIDLKTHKAWVEIRYMNHHLEF
jgi:hypothetical protein